VAWIFTIIGSVEVVVPAILAVLVWAWRRGDRRAFYTLVGTTAVAQILNIVLKEVFPRARPVLWPGVDLPDSPSFPSGHSMAAAAMYGMIAVVAARLAPRYRAIPILVTPLLVLAVGASRLVLGKHWPTDVLGGFTGGAFVVLLGVTILGPEQKRPDI
jgi:undecaprenyl-diphosphatase